jgi:PEP-CTERM motif
MNFKRALAVGSLALVSLGAAQAQTTWNFAYTGPEVTASGSFVTAGAALTPEDILSITGFRNGQPITGLVPVDTDPGFIYDNQFTSVAPNFTDGGMLFSVAGVAVNVNVYFFEGDYFEVGGGALSESPIAWSVSAAPVPEPATVLSMLAGLGLVGAYMRKRSAAA